MSEPSHLWKYIPSYEDIKIIDVEREDPLYPSSPKWRLIDPEEDERHSRKEKLRKLHMVKKDAYDEVWFEYLLDEFVRRDMLHACYQKFLDQDEYKDMPTNQKESILSSVGKSIHIKAPEELIKRTLSLAQQVEEEEVGIQFIQNKRRRLCL